MRSILCVTLLVALSLYARGDAATAALNEEQWSRFYARFTGRFQLNPAKSLYFKGQAPKGEFIIWYLAQPDGRSVKFMDSPLHYLDGRENRYSTNPNNTRTVAREVLDEFTVANTAREHGRIIFTNTYVLSPDGDARIHIRMSVDEREKWAVDHLTYYERVK